MTAKIKKFKLWRYLYIVLPITGIFFLSADIRADIEDEICDWSGGYVGCEGESNFTEFQGYYKPPDPGAYGGIFQCFSFRECVLNYTNFALGFLGLAAIITIIYGGYLYVLAVGEAEKTEKGKKNIIYAVIGILIIFISYGIVNTVLVYAPTGERDPGVGGTKSSPPGSSGNQQNSVSSSGSAYTDGSGNTVKISSEVQAVYRDLQSSYIFYNEVKDSLETNIAKIEAILADSEQMTEFVTNSSRLNSFVNETQNFYQGISSKARSLGSIQEKIDVAIKDLAQRSVALAFYEPSGPTKIFLINRAFAQSEETQELIERTEEVTKLLNSIICHIDKKQNTACTSAGVTDSADITAANQKDYNAAIKDQIVKIATLYVDNFSGQNLNNSPVYNSFKDAIGTPPENASELETNYEDKSADQMSNYGALGKLIYTSSATINNDTLKAAAEILVELQDEIAKIKRVNAVLTASSVNGIAPLTIQFDATASQDPTNKSLTADKYNWIIPTSNVTCTGSGSAMSCVFQTPGSYIMGLKVSSNDPQTVLASTVYLPLQVTPPKSKIKLKINNETVADYANYDDYNVNKESYKITLSEAKEGLTFDASGTTDAFGSAENITWYSFDFGDRSAKIEGGEKTVPHKYTKAGQYKFVLKVKDKVGNEDSKILNIYVETIVAKFKVAPPSAGTLTNFILDASASHSDSAAIESWKWEVQKMVKKGDKYEFEKITDPANSEDINSISENFLDAENAETVEISFKNPNIYRIDLTVTDEAEPANIDSIFQDIKVTSAKPNAIFTYGFPDPENNPGKVLLDASLSYDPDPNDTSLLYNWTIQNGIAGTDYLAFTSTTQKTEVTFLKTGNYQVTLEVKDDHPPSIQQISFTTKQIKIEKVLGLIVTTKNSSGDESSTYTLTSDANSNEITVTTEIQSQLANYYEADFGDGAKSEGELPSNHIASLNHIYSQTGVKEIKVTVFDPEGNDNNAEKVIKIGDGTKPVATFKVQADSLFIGESSYSEPPSFSSETKKYYRSTNFLFDSEGSINLDGTNRKLDYSWVVKKVSGSEKCENASINYQNSTEKEFSTNLSDTGKYFLKLTLKSREGGQEDNAWFGCIEIQSAAPKMQGLEATPFIQGKEAITPLKVDLRAISATDPDGKITRYLWWYDEQGKNERHGAHSTETAQTSITVNTIGKEGEAHTYYLFVELMDNEGAIYNLKTEYDSGRVTSVPSVGVKNGPNDPPEITVSVDKTSILKGESVNLTAKAKDPDGEIKSILWDLNSDLAFDNSTEEKNCLNKSACSIAFTSKNTDGYEIRARAIDAGSAEATSTPIKIYVDSKTTPPVAAFTFNEPQTGANSVTLKSTSEIHPDALPNTKYIWDKDTATDSDGDGVRDNDQDAGSDTKNEVTFTYETLRTYEIQLTVIDGEGNTDKISRSVAFKGEPVSKPKADFSFKTAEVDQNTGTAAFSFNASASQTTSGASIVHFYWDFDSNTAASSASTESSLRTLPENTDDNTQNDRQKDEITPTNYYVPGNYNVILFIEDSKGQTAQISKNISIQTPGTFPPRASFEITSTDQKNRLISVNASKSSAPEGHQITKYYYDFDLSKESGDKNFQLDGKNVNNDGLTNNDVENTTNLTSPVIDYTYNGYGTFEIQLTVESDTKDRASTQKTLSLYDPNSGLKPIAYLASTNPNQEDPVSGNIHLAGTAECVSWDYSASGGSGTYRQFIIDINTNYDLDKNGNSSDDKDRSFAEEGVTEICYSKEWASQKSIVTRLTVYDSNGQSTFVDRKIEFIEPLPGEIDARMITTPAKQQGGQYAEKIVIYGKEGNVTFDFSSSIGQGLKYCFDVNVYFDSNGNNVRDDDCVILSYESNGKPKPFSQYYNREWGKLKARIKIEDDFSQSDFGEVEIVFQDAVSANIFDVISFNVFLYFVATLGVLGIFLGSAPRIIQKILKK